MGFCTVVNCMDGRVQEPVISWLKDRFEVTWVDGVTEPGPNGILAAGTDAETIASIIRRVRISVDHHGSVGIAVVGHHDCAGNPGPEEQQREQTRAAVTILQEHFPAVPVIGLWVDEDWEVNEMDAAAD